MIEFFTESLKKIPHIKPEFAFMCMLPIWLYFFLSPFTKGGKEMNKDWQIIIFMGFGILFVTLLKGLLKIPHPKYPHTFATPSGHTFAAMTMAFTYLRTILKKFNHAILLTLIIGCIEGARVVVNGHHEPSDSILAILLFIPFAAIFHFQIFTKKANYYGFLISVACFSVFIQDFMSFWAPSYKIGLIKFVKVAIYFLTAFYIRDKILHKVRNTNKKLDN